MPRKQDDDKMKLKHYWENGAYLVSDNGDVFGPEAPGLGGRYSRLQLGRIGGYPSVGVYIDHIRKTRLVHRMVLETFVGPCPDGMECAHEDGVRTNCNLSNLQWKSH